MPSIQELMDEINSLRSKYTEAAVLLKDADLKAAKLAAELADCKNSQPPRVAVNQEDVAAVDKLIAFCRNMYGKHDRQIIAASNGFDRLKSALASRGQPAPVVGVPVEVCEELLNVVYFKGKGYCEVGCVPIERFRKHVLAAIEAAQHGEQENPLAKEVERLTTYHNKCYLILHGRVSRPRPINLDELCQVAVDRIAELEQQLATLTKELAEAKAAKEAAEATLVHVHELLKTADEERLKETHEADDEAEKWKSEGDMYGWNFHKGRAAGTVGASIIFYRVRRMLDDNSAGQSLLTELSELRAKLAEAERRADSIIGFAQEALRGQVFGDSHGCVHHIEFEARKIKGEDVQDSYCGPYPNAVVTSQGILDSLRADNERLTRERDEARVEVERQKKMLADTDKGLFKLSEGYQSLKALAQRRAEVLRQVEWDIDGWCSCCGVDGSHKPDCALSAALAEPNSKENK